MNRTSLLMVLWFGVLIPAGLCGQELQAPPRQAPHFTARLEEALRLADEACAEMASNHLLLRDEQGRPLNPRQMEGLRPSVEGVRRAKEELVLNPADLATAANLFLQVGDLADALYDFSQTAYDNDRETLGRRLVEISAALDRRQRDIETYTLDIAAGLQQRVRELEAENQSLHLRLDEALAKLKQTQQPQ